jgi:hypothetical protein
MAVVEIGITVLSILAILFFVIYLVGMRAVPTGRRARTPTFDRFGRPLPPSENPGYEETEEEQQGDG